MPDDDAMSAVQGRISTLAEEEAWLQGLESEPESSALPKLKDALLPQTNNFFRSRLARGATVAF